MRVETARTARHAKDIAAEAVGEWLEAEEDEEPLAGLGEMRQEWELQGGMEASEFFNDSNANLQR